MAYPITKLWYYPFCRLMIRRINGSENIPHNGRFIIAANHEKLIDSLYAIYPILRKLDRKVHFIASTRWWFLGETVCRKWAGCIPLFDTGAAYSEAKALLRHGNIVGIFPEGLIRKRKIKELKTGAVRLAMETNTPLLPIGIKSSYTPFGSCINIGKAVKIKKNSDVGEQTSKLMSSIYKLRNGC